MTTLTVTRPPIILAQDAAYIREDATGVRFAPDTPLEVWMRYLSKLGRDDSARRWRIGDALLFGETTYGELAAQALDEDGAANGYLAYWSLTQCKRVAAKVLPALRRATLPWSWHEAVCSLPDAEMDYVLDMAEEGYQMGDWTRNDLRAFVRELRGLPAPPERLTLVAGSAPALAGQLYDRLGREQARALAEELLARCEEVERA